MKKGTNLMQITFYNECDYVVHLYIESKDIIIIQPHDKAVMKTIKSGIKVCIKRNIISYKKKNKYNLVLEVQYQLINVHDNDIFRITHRKDKIEGNVYYDRLFLNSDNAICAKEVYSVLGAEEIKKKFNKAKKKYRFLISPFENLTGLTILLIMFGIILGSKLGGKFMIFYFPAIYLFLIFVDWILERTSQFIFGKIFKLRDYKTEFYSFFESEYISNYYKN